MKQKILHTFLGVVLLCGLSGCGKIVDWGMQTFDQGTDAHVMYEAGRANVRSTTIYDQFNTAGMFDALWLSDQVRTAYASAYSVRRAKSEESQKTFLRRQLEENNHFITFYVLSLYELPLGEPQSEWQLYLKVDGTIYHPIEVKVTELDLEYKAMFAKRYTRFKESYIVRFSAKDLQDHLIITDTTRVIELCFKSNTKQTSLIWQTSNSKSVSPSMRAQEVEEKKEARLQPESAQVNP